MLHSPYPENWEECHHRHFIKSIKFILSELKRPREYNECRRLMFTVQMFPSLSAVIWCVR